MFYAAVWQTGKDRMKEADKAKWAGIREKGALRFILVYGVLGWGLGTAALFVLLMWLAGGFELGWLLRASLVIFPVGGLAWGGLMWWIMDRIYSRA